MSGTALPAGPWDHEPSHVRWTTLLGYDCVIHRGPMGGLCEYVRVPEGHFLHGVSYSEPLPPTIPDATIDEIKAGTIGKRGVMPLMFGGYRDRMAPDLFFDVHGSLTYSEGSAPGEDIQPAEWWFGFDCSHSGDLTPSMLKYGAEDGVYRDIEYVRSECESLAAQLAAVWGRA